MKISVVIPSRNRCDNLMNVVEALNQQTLSKEEYEVIVVDDNSKDGTKEVIENYRDILRLKYIFTNIPKPHTWNASVIRNLGAVAADPSTQAYYFVDSDVILPPDALANVVNDLETNPNRVIIGPYDFYAQDNQTIKVPDVRNLKFEETTIDQTFDTIHDGLACFGGNLIIPKDIFWSVKGFSSDTHIGLEDGDMGIKLWKKHTNFSYDKRLRGRHQWHETPPDRFPPDMAQYVNALNQKHFHMDTPDVDKSMDLITATRETYESWGITGWEVPPEWKENKIEFGLKVNKE